MAAPLLVLATLALANPAPVGTSTVSPPPRIDLISIGVGAEMYALFGHAAVRVVHADGTDLAYNFGGVDIEQPDFWKRVMQGRMETYLEVTPYTDLLLKYSGEDRTIVGRTLNFSPAQTEDLVRRLEQIRNSDARIYLYHYIYNNCTTKIAEVFDEVLQGKLRAQSQGRVRGTHRDWILDRLHHLPALYIAMDLVGNGMGDVPMTAWERQYIPEGFDQIIDAAEFDHRPFVKRRYIDYRSMSFDKNVIWDWPWTKVYLLFLMPLLLLGLAWPRFTAAVWGLTGQLIGLAYIGVWLGSDYVFYHGNWNMLVFPVTHGLLLWSASSGRAWRSKTTRVYLGVHAGVLTLLLLGHGLGLISQAIGPMLALGLPLSWALGIWQVRARDC